MHLQSCSITNPNQIPTFSCPFMLFRVCLLMLFSISAGDLSEDPNFPKIQWPSPEMCPLCHSVRDNGEHRWNLDQVLAFLLSYYSPSNILTGTQTNLPASQPEDPI